MNHLSQSETSLPDPLVEPMPLTWGHTYLMCPPDHFGVFYEINPWMHQENPADLDLAEEQWHQLVANPQPMGRDQTFTPTLPSPACSTSKCFRSNSLTLASTTWT